MLMETARIPPPSLSQRSRGRPGGNPSAAAATLPFSLSSLAAAKGHERAKPGRRRRRRGHLVSLRGGVRRGPDLAGGDAALVPGVAVRRRSGVGQRRRRGVGRQAAWWWCRPAGGGGGGCFAAAPRRLVCRCGSRATGSRAALLAVDLRWRGGAAAVEVGGPCPAGPLRLDGGARRGKASPVASHGCSSAVPCALLLGSGRWPALSCRSGHSASGARQGLGGELVGGRVRRCVPRRRRSDAGRGHRPLLLLPLAPANWARFLLRQWSPAVLRWLGSWILSKA